MSNSSLQRWIFLWALACMLVASAGCGQKGDLYLPDKSARKADVATLTLTTKAHDRDA